MNYRIQNITYQYAPDGREVLKDVSLEIQKSAVTAVVGPSGCGKTTLVDILSGVIPKLESNGVLQGELELGEDALVSVVSQSPENQLFGYGVEDAIAFGMENMGLPAEEIADRMEYGKRRTVVLGQFHAEFILDERGDGLQLGTRHFEGHEVFKNPLLQCEQQDVYKRQESRLSCTAFPIAARGEFPPACAQSSSGWTSGRA